MRTSDVPLHIGESRDSPMCNGTSEVWSGACHRAAQSADPLGPSRNDSGMRLPAAHRRHQHLVATAGAAVDFLAGAELQVLAQADPHLAEPGPVAGHCDRRGASPGLTLMKASSMSAGATVL